MTALARIFFILAATIFSWPATAQSVQQSGSVTSNHAPCWVSNGVIRDCGSAADSSLSTLGVTSNSTSGFCISSGRVTAAGRQQMCFGAPLADSAVISLQNYGTATEQALKFVINGVEYSFPGSLSGIVVGTTPITGGSNGSCLYDNNGVVGAVACGASAITQLTGDVSATGPGAVTATLATVNVNVGSFGSATQVPVITVDAKGRITAASNTTLTAQANALVGTTLAANVVNSSLTSVGALSSGSLASGFTVVTGALGGTGVANTGKTITLGGSLTTSGAFDSTFTMTGATNVTFPTSGTLATTTGANVATVSNSDGTLTISPTSGAVVASLALGHANTWTAQQTFTNNLIAVLGSSTGFTTFASANSGATNYTATFPANSGTVAELNLAQSWTATQTLQTILAGTTNTYDIGTDASTAAFRTIYAGTSFVGPLFNASTGFQIGGAATSGQYLRGNGTNFVSSAIQATDVPAVADASGAPSATFGVMKCDGTTTTCSSGVVTAIGGAATDVTIGTTTVTSGTAGYGLYNNSGVLGNKPFVANFKVTKFTSSGTYTADSSLVFAVIECVGGGGGGGGSAGTSANFYAGAGGGSGSYSRVVASAATIGASQSVTIGTGGTGGAGATTGSAGNDTSVGSLCVGKGGSGGSGGSNAVAPNPGAGGVAGTGDVTVIGQPGSPGYYNSSNDAIKASFGGGGSSVLGAGAMASDAFLGNLCTAGVTATGAGGGGSGGNCTNTTNTTSGGDGASGVVIVTEFLYQ
jgi:hypothetical protein